MHTLLLTREKSVFTTIHYSAKCSLEIACRQSVTLVDCDHISWKSWKLIAGTISPTSSLLVAQRPCTYFQGNKTKFWGVERERDSLQLKN